MGRDSAFRAAHTRTEDPTPKTLNLNTLTAKHPTQAPSGAAALRRWLHEPLLHFLVLGALLFAVDSAISSRSEDPRTIVIDQRVDAEARETFAAARGRDPNEAELRALRKAWLDNEVLYREGLALQVDRGDPTIRDRVIFKTMSIVETNITRPQTGEDDLREWFERNRARYDEPERYDFREAVLAGERSEEAVRRFVRALEDDSAAAAEASLRVFKARPRDNIVHSYGAAFAEALQGAPLGHWVALPTEAGWRAIQVDAVTAARPADFGALHNVVHQDWVDTSMAEARSAAVREMAEKYVVRYEGVRP